jgi:hypothetical protein
VTRREALLGSGLALVLAAARAPLPRGQQRSAPPTTPRRP